MNSKIKFVVSFVSTKAAESRKINLKLGQTVKRKINDGGRPTVSADFQLTALVIELPSVVAMSQAAIVSVQSWVNVSQFPRWPE